jgi:hypothetical protein
LLAFAGVEFAAMPRVEISEAAAPATRAAEKARLFIMMISLSSGLGRDGLLMPASGSAG